MKGHRHQSGFVLVLVLALLVVGEATLGALWLRRMDQREARA